MCRLCVCVCLDYGKEDCFIFKCWVAWLAVCMLCVCVLVLRCLYVFVCVCVCFCNCAVHCV